MDTRTLHYVYDPLCGWCYATAPLLEAAVDDGLKIALHAGGMMMGPGRQMGSVTLRSFVLPHVHRITAMTGQQFGDAYTNRLLQDPEAAFDSEPPITAILAAGERGVALLAKIQRAQFVEGRRFADRAVLLDLAEEIGLEPDAFAAAFDESSGEGTRQHVLASCALLHRVGGSGFPTFCYQQRGAWKMLDSSRYLGQVAEWRAALAAIFP